MPELPEVETTRRHLAEHLPGARVAAVALLDPRALLRPDPATFAARVVGATVLAVARRAKYLIVPLTPTCGQAERSADTGVAACGPRAGTRPAPTIFGGLPAGGKPAATRRRPRSLPASSAGGAVANGQVWTNASRRNGQAAPADDYLIVHRRMTGNLLLREPGAPPDAHTVAVLTLDDGRELRFCDMRRFAKLWLADAAEVAALDRALGPEPLTRLFTAERLAAALRGRRGSLKPLLLNQNLVAGLGNIYVDEALFAARLHPTRTVDTLTDADFRRLHRAIRAVLAQGIRNEGTTFRDYLGAVGQPGRNQMMVEVFKREGKPCSRCRTLIRKTRVGGRGTHYCPRCQQ
ncbi:MAG TPA: bifunctional DNA-formamidopyrimidine glycosylase/DNA-(apurinic or apyrimidinic site) lyase [Chloroflexota bacterium]|nr:bifunctional DNA-formamidopyrimidine glycosylase/DNA-(apurinic or apyrimidinic site) lyase [Chloroflexota bacterium]